MGRNTYQTCKAIIEDLLNNPEIKISKEVLWSELKPAIEKNGGEHYLTLKKYMDALVKHKFLEKIGEGVYRINDM